MPLMRPTGISWRPPSIGRVAVVSSYRGTLRVQAWPRKRGLPKHPRDRARLKFFALVQKAFKLLQAVEIIAMRQALKKHNRRNRGQRGSAAIRFRDWEHQRISGRGFAFTLPGQITIYPPGVQTTATRILDHTWLPGEDMLVRKNQTWEAITKGKPGQLLFAQGPANLPRWLDL